MHGRWMVVMTETTEKTEEKGAEKPLKLSQPGRLELKKTVQSGQVKQSFSHGRSKTVAVEVKRKRTFRTGESGRMTEVTAVEPTLETAAPAVPEIPAAADTPAAPAAEAPQRRTLTKGEQEARERALEAAQARTHEAPGDTPPPPIPGLPDVPGLAQEVAVDAGVAEIIETPEEAERRRIEQENLRRQGEDASRLEAEKADRATAGAPPAQDGARARRGAAEEDERERGKGRSGAGARDRAKARGQTKRRSGKLTISQALSDDVGERQRSLAAMRRRQQREKQKTQGQFTADQDTRKIVREAVIPETITVSEFANRLAVRGNEVIKVLMAMDIMATVNQTIDQDTAELVAEEMVEGGRRRRVRDQLP